MTSNLEEHISPTLSKILDAYQEALIADDNIDESSAKRLVEALRGGRIPKNEELDLLLLPEQKENAD